MIIQFSDWVRWKKLSLEGDGQGSKSIGGITDLNVKIIHNQGKSCGGVSQELKLNLPKIGENPKVL